MLAQCSSFVMTHRVIWLKSSGLDAAVFESSLIFTMALRIVAQASFTSATSFGSSKMPQGTWQWPPRRRSTKWRGDSFELFAGEDQALLVGRDALLVLDL